MKLSYMLHKKSDLSRNSNLLIGPENCSLSIFMKFIKLRSKYNM